MIKEVRLALEGFAQRRVVEEGLLDGDGAAETLVGGEINRAHPALSDLFDNAVTILEQRAGFDHINLLDFLRASAAGKL